MDTLEQSTSVIVACAGNATRMRGENKIFLPLGDSNVLGCALQALAASARVCDIVVVARVQDHDAVWKTVQNLGIDKVKAVVEGGSTRQQSVLSGLHSISKETRLLAIHDGARPLVRTEDVDQVIYDANVFGAATLGVPVKDTIKIVDDHLIVDTPYRPSLYQTQTPQVFRRALYFEAVTFAKEHDLDFTDDCQMVEALGQKVYMTTGDYTNLKVTTPEDIAIVRAIFAHREEQTT